MLRAYRVLLLAAVLAFLIGPSLVADAPSIPLPVSQLPPGSVARLGAVRLTHPGAAYDAAFSPDGKRLVSVGRDFTIKLWDTANGKLLRRFEAADGKTFPVSVAYSPDGQYVTIDRAVPDRVRVTPGFVFHERKGRGGEQPLGPYAFFES